MPGAPIALRRLEQQSGPATARDVGWRAAKAPLVAFTDDDCVPQPGWLRALVDGLTHADIVQGQTLPDPVQRADHGPFSRTLEVTGESGFYQTCNMGYRRAVLEGVGGFDRSYRYPAGEDVDLAWRAIEAGASTRFVPDALVHHDVRPSSLLTHLRDTRRWEGIVLLVRRHPDLRRMFHRRWFWKPAHPPAIAALAGLLLVAASGGSGRRRVAGLALLAPYIRYRTRVLPIHPGRRRRYVYVPAGLVSDLAEVGVLAAASARYRTLLL
jgi:GT2 family glycosyltransferase